MRPDFFICARFLLLSAVTAHANAAWINFAGNLRQIPAPDDFAAVGKRAPTQLATIQAFIPAGKRAVDLYVPPAVATKLERHQSAQLDRYFILGVSRSDEGKLKSFDAYSNSDLVEKELRRQFANAKTQASELAAQASEKLHKPLAETTRAMDARAEFLGITHKEPWGLFYCAKLTDAQGAATIGCDAVVDINFQLLSLTVYSPLRGASDRAWAEHALLDWAETIRRANPDDPQLATLASRSWTRADFEHIGRDVGVFLGITAALLWGVRRKRAK